MIKIPSLFAFLLFTRSVQSACPPSGQRISVQYKSTETSCQVANCLFIKIVSTSDGGAVFLDTQSTLNNAITQTTFLECRASGKDGGCCFITSSNISLTECCSRNCSAHDGQSLYLTGSNTPHIEAFALVCCGFSTDVTGHYGTFYFNENVEVEVWSSNFTDCALTSSNGEGIAGMVTGQGLKDGDSHFYFCTFLRCSGRTTIWSERWLGLTSCNFVGNAILSVIWCNDKSITLMECCLKGNFRLPEAGSEETFQVLSGNQGVIALVDTRFDVKWESVSHRLIVTVSGNTFGQSSLETVLLSHLNTYVCIVPVIASDRFTPSSHFSSDRFTSSSHDLSYRFALSLHFSTDCFAPSSHILSDSFAPSSHFSSSECFSGSLTALPSHILPDQTVSLHLPRFPRLGNSIHRHISINRRIVQMLLLFFSVQT
jgi:hypothetical protein